MRLFLFASVLMLAGCSFLKFPQLNSPNPPDQVYSYHQTISKTPRVVHSEGGKSYVWEEQKQSVDVNYDRKEKHLTWWQRFTNWLGNLGMLGIVAFIIFFFVAPGAAITFLNMQKDKFKKAFTQTVRGIEESKAVKQGAPLKEALSASQDNDVKMMVDDIKRDQD